MIKKVYIYSGYGTSEFCLKQLTKFFQKQSVQYELITPEQIKSNFIFEPSVSLNEKLLCFGGGFDLGYLSSLEQTGCSNIQSFVNAGGNYLGICAGAYFGCDYIEFDMNGPLHVVGPRLGFYKGKAVGPINSEFKYNSEDHCLAVNLEVSNGQQVYCYLNGGPFFEPSEGNVLARYNEDDCKDKPAILECKYGLGKCVLSGVHFEFDPNDLDLNNENVKNNVYPKMILNSFNVSEIVLNVFK